MADKLTYRFILIDKETGTAFAVHDGDLLAAPINADGSIEKESSEADAEYNWCDVDFGRGLDEDIKPRCEAIRETLRGLDTLPRYA